MTKKNSLLSLLLTLCLCLVLAAPALAAEVTAENNIENDLGYIEPRTTQSYMVSITPVIQAKNNWCWAACAAMVGKQANPKTTITQVDVVRKTFGDSLPDYSASILGICYGAHYVKSNGVYPTSLLECDYDDFGKKEFFAIEPVLRKDIPLIGIFKNNKNNTQHAMVIYGTQFIDDASGSQQKVSFIDPSDGKRYTYKYSELLNGTYNNLVYYNTVHQY